MIDKRQGLALDGAHWRFTLDLYGRSGVSSACLHLQDTHNIDVNLLLVALYSALQEGRSVSTTEIASLDAAVREQRRALVLLLRAIRCLLKPLPFGPETATLRSVVKKAELSAEQFEQLCLAREASTFQPGKKTEPEKLCWDVILHFDHKASAASLPATQACVATIADAAGQVR